MAGREEQVRVLLAEGLGPDAIVKRITGRAHDSTLHSLVIVEKTKREGTYMTVPATKEAVAAARDERTPMPRWKELAAMVFGDAGTQSVNKVRALYEQARGPGSAHKSWTGRGRKPSSYS
jgi:hypothetical protein